MGGIGGWPAPAAEAMLTIRIAAVAKVRAKRRNVFLIGSLRDVMVASDYLSQVIGPQRATPHDLAGCSLPTRSD